MNWDRMERATLNKGGREGIFCNAKTIAKVRLTERMTVMLNVRISLLSLSHSGPFSGSNASTPSVFSTFLQSSMDACSWKGLKNLPTSCL